MRVEREQAHEALVDGVAEDVGRVRAELLAVLVVLRAAVVLHHLQGALQLLVRHPGVVGQRQAEVRQLRGAEVWAGRAGARELLRQRLWHVLHDLLVQAGLLAPPVFVDKLDHRELAGDKAHLHRHQLPSLVYGRGWLLRPHEHLPVAGRPVQGGRLGHGRDVPSGLPGARGSLDRGAGLDTTPLVREEIPPGGVAALNCLDPCSGLVQPLALLAPAPRRRLLRLRRRRDLGRGTL
mmetsp:Transcript_40881/g.97734  ORF Transcript_40881/g.97734 Transcript_40881/m.97734 type:complete len:236 (+) Transcript_40881:628-1335(+)